MRRKIKCFVMMPSGLKDEYKGGKEEASFVYEHIIRRAVENVLGTLHVEIHREIDDRKPGDVPKSIIKNIAECDLCIVDGTRHNPNVWLELGIRYALRSSTTILLIQQDTESPFDVRHYHHVVYSSLYSGAADAVRDLEHALRAVYGDRRKGDIWMSPRLGSDSPVFDALPNWTGYSSTTELEAREVIDWNSYWNKLQDITRLLVEKIPHAYKPDLFVGITNGGGMFCDLLSMEIKKSAAAVDPVPVVMLWADRTKLWEDEFIDNDVNRGVFSAITAQLNALEDPEILLLDDNVASGGTAKFAINFLKKVSSKFKIRFLPMFSLNRRQIHSLYESKSLLWNHPTFSFSIEEVLSMHEPTAPEFPYGKGIRQN